jgi:hypothetical protein
MAAAAAARAVAAVGWGALQAEAGSDNLGMPSEAAAAAHAAAPTPGFDAAGLPTAEHWSALAAAPAAARRAQLRWALLAALRGGDGESAPGTAVLLAAAAGVASPSERAGSQVSWLCWQLGAVLHAPHLVGSNKVYFLLVLSSHAYAAASPRPARVLRQAGRRRASAVRATRQSHCSRRWPRCSRWTRSPRTWTLWPPPQRRARGARRHSWRARPSRQARRLCR